MVSLYIYSLVMKVHQYVRGRSSPDCDNNRHQIVEQLTDKAHNMKECQKRGRVPWPRCCYRVDVRAVRQEHLHLNSMLARCYISDLDPVPKQRRCVLGCKRTVVQSDLRLALRVSSWKLWSRKGKGPSGIFFHDFHDGHAIRIS